MTDLSITNARLVLPSGEIATGSVRCAGDRIESVGDCDPTDEAIDAKGALLAPALVDLGVFAVDKPACHFGGIARVGLMPDGEMLDAPAPV
ncbi:MAG: dihydroorotase, partial [Sphingomonadales bacterium CG12_big_fil_rev_8_21_14_0_65_65_10]